MSATLLEAAALAAPAAARPSTAARWAGRIMLGLVVLFLTFDTVIKFVPQNEAALQATMALGWQPHHVPIIGALSLLCLVLYVVPRTAPLGALLWTGYLGGAIATHLRVDNPLLSHTLFPIYVAALLWGALYLRDARVRTLVGALLRPAR